ncbi:hypothetical protein [Deinococcus sp. JMULE3]|uniref:hypothetical protein n=1 Tax=Deinococcus sp. JMULE3 TaxID=2518341 RepID=UPI0015752B2D|nr:hypothetical protein [Deinococcus sp. JMULE3]NTY01630.1 hypothetical protein [Deinococcus sp. JMULE3]
MTGHEGSSPQLAQVQEASLAQRRRVAEVRARQHVGAAGWAQNAALNAIIQAGREGLAATDALRDVLHLTSAQLRDLPLSDEPGRQEHIGALQRILDSGEAQVSAAQTLDALVTEALDEVTRLPVSDVSAAQLDALRRRVRQQVDTLDLILQAARAQTTTLEQLGELQRVSEAFHGQVAGLQILSASEEAQVLGEAGEQLVHRLGNLEDSPQQLSALTRIGEAVAEQLADTGDAPAAQADALEDLARHMDGKATELREA